MEDSQTITVIIGNVCYNYYSEQFWPVIQDFNAWLYEAVGTINERALKHP